jgi:thiol-disulfide isomerase/thioredoxin
MKPLALFFILAVAGLATSFAWAHAEPNAPVQATSAEDEKVASPEVIALKFHADWCGSCRAMGPVFTDLGNKFDTKPVLFLELDHTSEPSRRQAEYLAAVLGLQEVWKKDGGSTGFILLIDADTHEVLAKLTKEQDIKAMGGQLLEAIDRASASKR